MLDPKEIKGPDEDPEPSTPETLHLGDRSVSIDTARDLVVITGDENEVVFGPDHDLALSEFEMSEAEIEEAITSFVVPLGYDEISRLMNSRQLLCIVGPPESGKTTVALSLAHSQRAGQSVYRIKGTRAWSIVSESTIEDSVILLKDAVYLIGASGSTDASSAEPLYDAELEDEETDDTVEEIDASAAGIDKTADPESEVREECVHPLKQLTGRGNTIIITATEETLAKVIDNPAVANAFEKHGFVFDLNHDSYGRAERLRLIKKAINLAHQKELNAESKQWALNACAKLELDQNAETDANDHPIFREWLPGEIVSFVSSILASAKSQDEIEAALRISLKKRVHSWFMELDESIRCFVLTRVILPDLDEHELHEKMEEIIGQLKKTYSLTMSTPGVYSYHAAPYISDRPPYQFVNAHVLKAITDVVARFYHQPFRQLCSLLVSWTVPSKLATVSSSDASSKSEREKLIRESALLRDSVARIAGNVGKYDLNSVRDLLEAWAAHPLRRIGQAAGVALREALVSEAEFEPLFQQVQDWARKPGTGHFQKRSAADALWRLISVGLSPGQCGRAIRLLDKLGQDSNAYVRRAVVYAASQVAHSGQVTKAKDLLEQLATDQREDIRTYVALCLASPSPNRSEIEQLINTWTNSSTPRLFEVAILYLLMNYGRREQERLLHLALHQQPDAFKKALTSAIKLLLQRRSGGFTLRTLRRFVSHLALSGNELDNQVAIFALSDLRRRAPDFGRDDIEGFAHRLLREWEASENENARWAVCGCSFNAATNSEERQAILHEKLDATVVRGEILPQVAIAKRLTCLALKDRDGVHQVLQDWLVLNHESAISTVVFYWLLASTDNESDRLENLMAILDYFPKGFERALAQAVDSLLADEITPVLENFAFHERAVVRKQAALGLGRMACNGHDSVYELLEDWLAVEDANAGATVVLFWLTGGTYTEDERYESLKAIQATFPLIFDRGVREAARVLGTECLTPRVAQLMQFSVL